MQVFKFGGASIKDVGRIKNVGNILQKEVKKPIVVVISALGKTTNELELVVKAYFNGDDFQKFLSKVYDAHIKIARKLVKNGRYEQLQSELLEEYEKVATFLEFNDSQNYNYIYDQVVSLGELMSTKIVSTYLLQEGFDNEWMDVRDLIKTNHAFTEANLDWDITEKKIKDSMLPVLKTKTVITQGFLGSTPERLTTTLGREGSDFTASVISFCLGAEKMTVWKDVEGVLNADPRLFEDTVKIDRLTFREAIEMSFYGAQVLHPKTIKPLQNKNIPLVVRSFLQPDTEGTLIQESFDKDIKLPPVIVYKKNQVLISFAVKDFSFIGEDNLREIFHAFAENRMRINLMHNQAVSFSACVDFKKEKIDRVIDQLQNDFEINLYKKLELLTIRHYTKKKYEELVKDKNILRQQNSADTIQVLMY